MNKMHLIIRQEYLNRVRKRSFIAMTLLMPFLFCRINVISPLDVKNKRYRNS